MVPSDVRVEGKGRWRRRDWERRLLGYAAAAAGDQSVDPVLGEGQPVAAPTGSGRPQVRPQVDLEVAFGRERLQADVTLERFLSGVRSRVYLQCAGARKSLPARLADVAGR